MTNDELTQTFIDAGFDTPQKVQALLTMAGLQMTLRAKQIALEALTTEQSAAVATINGKRAALQTDINDLTAQISAASAPSA